VGTEGVRWEAGRGGTIGGREVLGGGDWERGRKGGWEK